MGNNIVITIGREFGSGGREIGQKVAKTLGINYYDKNLIDIAAGKSGISSDLLYQADEKASNPFFSAYLPTGTDYGTVNDRLFWIQSEIIKELAQNESCVIVGRCSNYILKDMINAIHVFIYSNTHSKIRRIMERQNMTETAAKKHISKIEKERKEYYKYYTDCAWGDKADYDICIESSKFSKEEIVDYLAQIVSNRIAFLNGLEKKNE